MTNEEMLVRLVQELEKPGSHRCVSGILLRALAPRKSKEEVLGRIKRELAPWHTGEPTKDISRLQLWAKFPIDKDLAIRSIIIAAFLSGLSQDDQSVCPPEA